ncbi:MAG TPA: DciA family protein [Candidatus Limnocylindrales bacterium]|jgi:hypothetical protein
MVERRRPMRRLSELLPEAAAELGIEADLQRARLAAAWERTVAEHVPAAAGGSHLVSVEERGVVVGTADPAVAQELRLRATELLEALVRTPAARNITGIRVVVQRDRPATGDRPPPPT